jgi:hypothetical protein
MVDIRDLMKEVLMGEDFNTQDYCKYYRMTVDSETKVSSRVEIHFTFEEGNKELFHLENKSGIECNVLLACLSRFLVKRCIFHSTVPFDMVAYVSELISHVHVACDLDLRNGVLLNEGGTVGHTFIPLNIDDDMAEIISRTGEGG